MQVILLRDVTGIGQKGSVKNVSDGHALNYLIPNRLVEMATPEKIKEYEKQKADDAAAAAQKEKEWTELAKHIDGKKIEMKANAGKQGHLYEKISGGHIATAIREQLKITIPPDAVAPKMSIKEIGEWPVEIKLGIHKATIIVTVKS
ncbi:50S ribosomal protein L9 [Candidatus Kaiserbacteria bacterium RIFCSPHIGHO2_01_FULL_56_24]|uniref:Large ribosomal subunit protein bL9 n=1 Tax=Candidatus Kaiserbacteria bacterium RIFCSPHIGHO2_01_FULL_56_24 TaxID=1798487 RepID=A0A1F6D8Q9_9BACT|nr:MAG: 50S ribosomal protein L9 [Candidatus Kaiserbacteria bacterium RIFCSPHIGHO2_01_FULL_56_24]